MEDVQLVTDGYLMILGIQAGEAAALQAARDADVTMSAKALEVIRRANPAPSTADLDEIDPLAEIKEQIASEGPVIEANGVNVRAGEAFIDVVGALVEGIERRGTPDGQYYRITMAKPVGGYTQNPVGLAVLYRLSQYLDGIDKDDYFKRISADPMVSVSAYLAQRHGDVVDRGDGVFEYNIDDPKNLAFAKAVGRIVSAAGLTYPTTFTVYWPAWDGTTGPAYDADAAETERQYPAAADFPMRAELPADQPTEAEAPRLDPFATFSKQAPAEPTPLDPIEARFLVPDGF